MSFNPPSVTPSLDTDRKEEDKYWRQKRHEEITRSNQHSQPSHITSSYAYARSQPAASTTYTGHARPSERSLTPGNISEKIGEFLGGRKGDLPMYKDKPHHPQGRQYYLAKILSVNGRRRRGAVLGALLLFSLWWIGVFSSTPRADVRHPPTQSFSLWSWLNRQEIDWEFRRDEVKKAFITSWDDYAKHAWGTDEYGPLTKTGQMLLTPRRSRQRGTAPMGWIIVDGLDTAIMMNLTSRVADARKWIAGSLDFSQADGEVNTFETTIRVLGGLLSAHYLSTRFPHLAPQIDDDVGAKGEDLYIEKAVDLADRILGAFDSPSGIPYSSFNPNTSEAVPSASDLGASSTAEAATLQLELKYVAQLTGEPYYWEKAEDVMRVIDANRREGGLVPIFIYPSTGQFSGNNIRLGSRGDSYYEYLIKQYLQTGEREPIYRDMWDEAMQGIKEHLIAFSKHGNFTVVTERPSGLDSPLIAKMDHLVCFLPGTIALAVTGGETVSQAKKRMGKAWGRKQEDDLILAEELMKTCWGMYAVTPTGLAPEITYFVLDEDSPSMWQGRSNSEWRQPRSTVNFEDHNHGREKEAQKGHGWWDDFDIHSNDVHNLQRPETVESLFYMWRITRDEKYRHWGWKMFKAFVEHTAVHEDDQGRVVGYTSLDSVMAPASEHLGPDGRPRIVRPKRDNMEGFWLAETLKYLYLLFSDEHSIPDEWFDLTKVVINTEAHFFPRFDIATSKVFKTGWKRTSKPDVEAVVRELQQRHAHDHGDEAADHEAHLDEHTQEHAH